MGFQLFMGQMTSNFLTVQYKSEYSEFTQINELKLSDQKQTSPKNTSIHKQMQGWF